jgi:pyruvate,water dikinase
MQLRQFDPLHRPGSDTVCWTTVNAAENFPDVLTPLGWGFWETTINRATLGAFCNLGVIPESEVKLMPSVDQRPGTVFYGRLAANLDLLRWLADRIPGTSGDALEQQLFSSLRPGVRSQTSARRYPMIAVKAPVTIAALPRRIAGMSASTRQWWSESVQRAADADLDTARTLLAEANATFERTMRLHLTATFFAQGLNDQLGKLAERAGQSELGLSVMVGLGLEESRLVDDIWDCAHDRISVDAFLAAHGYHAHGESEIFNRSWREDPSQLDGLLKSYGDMDAARSPQRRRQAHQRERRNAVEHLLARIPSSRRRQARAVIALAHRYIPLRETGKTAFLRSIDVGRAAARRIAEHLAQQGVLKDPEECAMLLPRELCGDLPADLPGTLTFRRERFDQYRATTVPDSWTGSPEPLPLTATSFSDDSTLRAIGASPGIAEARARVVRDPFREHLEDGEILVCPTTDPSWASLFPLAAGLVIDIGGVFSHGAIIARELGLPCVINTGVGTTRFRTGDVLRLDGTAGTVDVVSRTTRS